MPGRRWWRRPARSWGRSWGAPAGGGRQSAGRGPTGSTDIHAAGGPGILAPCPTSTRRCPPPRGSPSRCAPWSPSVFDNEYELGDDQLVTLLTAAQWAPSWGNSQPWRFFVARRGDRTHGVLVEHLSRGNSGWVPRASVVLLTATQVRPDEDGEGGGVHAAYDLGQAAAHITFQAPSMGLHAHQFAGFDRAAVAARLGVPPHYAVLSGIAIGRRGAPDDVDERHPWPGGPGTPTPAAGRVRLRRRLGHAVADPHESPPTPQGVLLVVLVLFINLPMLHSTWTVMAGGPVGHGRHREVADHHVLTPRATRQYWLGFRFPEDIDPDQGLWTARSTTRRTRGGRRRDRRGPGAGGPPCGVPRGGPGPEPASGWSSLWSPTSSCC